MLQQLEEQVTNLKHKLSSVGEKIASLHKDQKELSDLEDALQIIHLLNNTSSNTPTASIASSVRLPRIDVPTFDGKVVNSMVFW